MAKKKTKFIGQDPFQKAVLNRFDSIDGQLKVIKKDIKFIRSDNASLEDHLNKKIGESERRLSQKIDQVGARLEDKIGHLEQIHPGGTHVAAI